MTTSLIAAGIFILTLIVKKYITPKFGATGVHVFVFLVAAIAFGVQAAMTYWPGFGALMISAGKYLVGSIAVYQILIKQIQEKVNIV